MQPSMNGREHRCSLLNQRLRSSYWSIGSDISNLLFAGSDDTLCRRIQITQKLKQHFAGRIERHRHCNLTNVSNTGSALNLHNLRDLNLLALAAYLGSLELEHGRSVVDMG